MRVRGLKLPTGFYKDYVNIVAPHAGAWIETMLLVCVICPASVAPHAGAWIETLSFHGSSNVTHVAPHAGAWIET